MKKASLTVAFLATSGVLHAQSSVTLFGVVDLAMSRYIAESQWYGPTPPGQPTPAAIKRSQTAMSSGANSTSRLGFRGSEDLGAGLKAGFWLESGFTADTGGSELRFDRRSTVSLSAPAGEIRMGRDYSPSYWNDTSFDPFGPVGVGTGVLSRISQNIARARASGTAPNTTDNAIRASNSVGYFLPKGLGGVYGQVMYAFGENPSDSDARRGRYIGGRLGYESGALNVAAAYARSTGDNHPGVGPGGRDADDQIRIANFGGSYDFGVLKLMGALTRTEADIKIARGKAAGLSSDVYTGGLIGMTVPAGAGLFKVAYSRMKSESERTLGLARADASINKFSGGYVHNLSKRTALYITASRVRITNGQNNPTILGLVTGGAPTYESTGAGIAGYAPRSATGWDVGLRHSF